MDFTKIRELLWQSPELIKKNLKIIIGIGIVLIIAIFGFYAYRILTTPQPDEQFSVTLTRGACFGACPIYSVTLNGKGIVNYKGDRFVKVTGERVYTVNVTNALQLRDYLREQKIFSFNNRYEQRATDLPSFTLVIHDQGQDKQIYVYGSKGIDNSVPEILFDIADAVDAAAQDQSLVLR